jgi:hypothetical protein
VWCAKVPSRTTAARPVRSAIPAAWQGPYQSLGAPHDEEHPGSVLDRLLCHCGALLWLRFGAHVFAAVQLWIAVNPTDALPLRERFNAVLEAIAVLTVSVAALELGPTVIKKR